MAAGTPVVATAVEGVRDLLGEGKFGVVVPLNGEPRLADAIRGALQELATLKTGALQGQQIVAEHFTWQSVAAEYERLYAESLARPAELPAPLID